MMGLREYARHRDRLGLPGATPAAVRAAIKAGRLSQSVTADKRRVRSAKAADAEWLATTKADMVPLTGPTTPANGNGMPHPVNPYGDARARREGAAAELAEIELAEKRGSLILARDVEARLADVFLRCRTRLLGILARLREQDPTLTGAQLALVERLLHEALEELAGGGP